MIIWTTFRTWWLANWRKGQEAARLRHRLRYEGRDYSRGQS